MKKWLAEAEVKPVPERRRYGVIAEGIVRAILKTKGEVFRLPTGAPGIPTKTPDFLFLDRYIVEVMYASDKTLPFKNLLRKDCKYRGSRLPVIVAVVCAGINVHEFAIELVQHVKFIERVEYGMEVFQLRRIREWKFSGLLKDTDLAAVWLIPFVEDGPVDAKVDLQSWILFNGVDGEGRLKHFKDVMFPNLWIPPEDVVMTVNAQY